MTRNAPFRPTRRAMLSIAAAALAAPAIHRLAQAQPAARGPLRRSAHELTERDAVVQSLRRGISVMRQRDSIMPQGLPHPGGWRQGALYHAQICGPSARLTGRRDPENEVHGGWWFLPWHRAYLAVMELLLREASGDPNLALPYWDIHANPSIPPIYQGDPATNPLAHATRRVGAFAGAPVPLAGAGRQTARQAVRATGFAEFAGARPTGGLFTPGHIESEAHNSAHAFVGGDMFDFSTAGFDPLFYALHANVDRLWEVWRNQGGGRAAPIDAAWGARRFAFQNQNGGMLQIATRDVETTRNLVFLEFGLNGARNVSANYAYDNDSFGAFGGVASAAPTAAVREFSYVLESPNNEKSIGAAPLALNAPAPPARSGAGNGGGTGSGLAAPASANGNGAPAPTQPPTQPPTAPPVPPAVTTGVAVDLLLTGVTLPQTPVRIVLEASRRNAQNAESFPVAERFLLPTLLGEAAADSRLSLSLDVGPGLMERNLRPAETQFTLRLETPEGETTQPLNFDRAVLRYR